MNKTVKPAASFYEFRCQVCDYETILKKKEEIMFSVEYHLMSHEPDKRHGTLYKKEFDDDLNMNKRLLGQVRL